MRLDELALRDMIWTAVPPNSTSHPSLSFPLPPLCPSPLLIPSFFFSYSNDRHLVAEKMPGATPRLSPLCMLLRLYATHIHTNTRTPRHYTHNETLLPILPFLFHSLTHTHTQLHFPVDPVTVDVITAFNLRGIRLPLTDLTAFTTQASRRL